MARCGHELLSGGCAVHGRVDVRVYPAQGEVNEVPALRREGRVRGVITGLAGMSLVMWIGNWISIDAGKGINSMCTVIGIMSAGAALALFIQGQILKMKATEER